MTERLRIVLATCNQHKAREITHILGSLPVQFLTLQDFPHISPVEEDGTTFEENAVKKALRVWHDTHLASLADDSGLEVDALGGRPGVLSARFAGENASYEDNNEKLVGLLDGVPSDKRRARFVCVAVLVTPKGKMILQRGEVEGVIVDDARGSGGFGYDPIFYVPRFGKTIAELDEEVKNSMSHRAKAFGGMKDFIAGLLPPA